MESGRARCGILVKHYDAHGIVTESHHGYRLSGAISSIQTELYTILIRLRTVKEDREDTHLYIDNRGALETLRSQHPVFEEIISDCKNIVQNIEKTGRSVTFMWVPSRVGITQQKGG